MLKFLTALFALPFASLTAAELKLAGVFTDLTVLQRDVAVPVWGWADPGEPIKVKFGGQTKTANAEASGKWLLRLDPMSASAEGRELVVQASDENRKTVITDVLVGDVWLCSGQSNMGISMSVPGNSFLVESIAKAGNPSLRLFATHHQFPDSPIADTQGRWETATPETVKRWIAIGYLFGDQIQRETGVPIGILASAMGGACIECWLPNESLQANPANRPYLEKHAQAVEHLPEALARYEKELAEFKQQPKSGRRQPREPDGMPNSSRNPAACFNGKIAPILPYALKGVFWYQGEGNVWGFKAYPSQMTDLMRVWRKSFGLPSLPFIMTELAPLGQLSPKPQDSARARFGEALSMVAKADDHAWVTTIVDGGDPLDIHPVTKEIRARRFAAMALAKVYGKPQMAHGPVLNSWQTTNNQAVLKFGESGSGLVAKQIKLGGHELAAEKLLGFELAGADRKFFRAEAHIQGNDTVVVTSAEVPQPVAVRYAWASFPLCNFFNGEGFAAYPFRTDDWPWQTPPDAPAAKAEPSPKKAKTSAARIGIREGHFFDLSTGKPFRPLGVNYFRTAPIEAGQKKRGHSAFSHGSYDEAFITRMMETLSRDGCNTVRSFLSNHSGPLGIVADAKSAEIHPAYLANLVHFLTAAQKHGIRVILSWDTWAPDCQPWAELPLENEARHGWVTSTPLHLAVNGFRLSPKPIRAKANAIRTLIEALRKSSPELLPVVLAWELENEVHFNLNQEPFLSRPAAFAFGGRQFDLRTDDGAQSLMDTASRTWASACADAIHAADPEALVSTSVFTFAAVGRQGPGTWSKDQTKDTRVPARPLALLESSLDFVDLHLYAGKSKTESIAQHLNRDLASVEMPALSVEAKRLGKPILIGESGVAAHFTRRGPDWQTIHHDVGVGLLHEFHQVLVVQPFAGVLHWHYGSPDSVDQDEFPALSLFPKYGEVLRTTWKAQ